MPATRRTVARRTVARRTVARRTVALGGGHGLFASLRALRRLPGDLTAVVTVADDGGSSGRIRRELGVLPPGDLRMALAALAGEAERERAWAELYQHRFNGSGALAGHPVGNLVLTGLMEQLGDPVAALDRAADVLGCVGRVLPMSPVPLDLVAEVEPTDRDDPVRGRRIRGQSAIATTPGRVRSVCVEPIGAPACRQAVEAVTAADAIVLGPGSWFTSVIPHLLVADLAAALAGTGARVVVTLNLVPQPGETDGFSPRDHLAVLRQYCPELPVAAVVVDDTTLGDHRADLAEEVERWGARLVVGPLRAPDALDRHDPGALAAALAEALSPDGAPAAGAAAAGAA